MVPERGTRVRGRRDRPDLELGMAEEQAEHLPPGIAAGTGDGDTLRHEHDYTNDGMSMHSPFGRTPTAATQSVGWRQRRSSGRAGVVRVEAVQVVRSELDQEQV